MTADSRDLNPIKHVWDSLGRRLRRRPNPLTSTNFVKHSFRNGTGRNQHFSQFYAPAMHCSGQFKRWSYPLLSCIFLTPTTLGQNFSQFLLTYGHDFSTKRFIMENTLNAYITIIPPVCFQHVSGIYFLFCSVYLLVSH